MRAGDPNAAPPAAAAQGARAQQRVSLGCHWSGADTPRPPPPLLFSTRLGRIHQWPRTEPIGGSESCGSQSRGAFWAILGCGVLRPTGDGRRAVNIVPWYCPRTGRHPPGWRADDNPTRCGWRGTRNRTARRGATMTPPTPVPHWTGYGAWRTCVAAAPVRLGCPSDSNWALAHDQLVAVNGGSPVDPPPTDGSPPPLPGGGRFVKKSDLAKHLGHRPTLAHGTPRTGQPHPSHEVSEVGGDWFKSCGRGVSGGL